MNGMSRRIWHCSNSTDLGLDIIRGWIAFYMSSNPFAAAHQHSIMVHTDSLTHFILGVMFDAQWIGFRPIVFCPSKSSKWRSQGGYMRHPPSNSNAHKHTSLTHMSVFQFVCEVPPLFRCDMWHMRPAADNIRSHWTAMIIVFRFTHSQTNTHNTRTHIPILTYYGQTLCKHTLRANRYEMRLFT